MGSEPCSCFPDLREPRAKVPFARCHRSAAVGLCDLPRQRVAPSQRCSRARPELPRRKVRSACVPAHVPDNHCLRCLSVSLPSSSFSISVPPARHLITLLSILPSCTLHGLRTLLHERTSVRDASAFLRSPSCKTTKASFFCMQPLDDSLYTNFPYTVRCHTVQKAKKGNRGI